MSTIPRGIYFVFPYTVGNQFLFPGPTGKFVDDTVLTTLISGQAGTPASIWPPGPDATFTWSGNITLSAGNGSSASPPATACAQRRWIAGREISFEGGSAIQQTMTRDSGRIIGAVGFCQRGNNNRSNWSQNVVTYRTPANQRVSWERVYVRVRKLPTTQPQPIWRCHGFPSAAAGAGILLSTAGQLRVQDIDNIGTLVDKGAVFTPTLNEWFRIDLFLRYGSGSPPTAFSMYINGVNVFYANSGMTGMSSNSRHDSSEIGGTWTTLDTEYEIDWDDWINADLPGNVDTSQLTFTNSFFSLDWLLGSHVRAHYSFSGSVLQTNWSPAGAGTGVCNQTEGPAGIIGTSELTSTTANAQIRATLDMLPPDVPDSLANVLGPIAGLICMYSKTSDGSDGQLGYSLAGGADVLSVVDQQVAAGPQQAAYLPSGVVVPGDITPFVAIHQKANNAATDTVYMMAAVIEYLGVWAAEDDPTFDYPVSRLSYLHNSRYDNSVFGYLGSEPAVPVYSGGFTYAGNGTYQEFTLHAPAHFVWIRPLTAGAGGHKMFGASLGGWTNASVQTVPFCRLWYDFVNQVFKMSVTGAASSEINVSGVNYQVCFFCDPGMRYNLCTAFAHGGSSATPQVNPLIAADFLAEFAFFHFDFNGVAGNLGAFMRGPGATGNNINAINGGGGLQANGANFAAGILNTFADLHTGNGNTSCSLWRSSDSGGGCGAQSMVQVMSYVGNNSNPRTINLPVASGRVPFFIFIGPIAPSGGQCYFRDPSHAGNNSSLADSMATSTVGITAVGVDSFTVQSGLNANGITYTVLALPGDTSGALNGTYVSTYCFGDGPWIPPSLPSGDINVIGNGGLILNGNAPITMLKDASGLYTLIGGKTNDTLIDRQAGQTTLDVQIPDPTWKTGYVGG